MGDFCIEAEVANCGDIQFKEWASKLDVLADLNRSTLDVTGYVKFQCNDIQCHPEIWDDFFEFSRGRKYNVIKTNRLTEDVLWSYGTKTNNWERTHKTVSLEEASSFPSQFRNDEFSVAYPTDESPSKRHYYHTIHLDCFEELNSWIHQGLPKSRWKNGLHTVFVYFGQGLAIFNLHVEDNRLCSVNVHFGGAPKLWTIIPPSHSQTVREACEKLRSVLLTNVKWDMCQDFIQHRYLYLSDEFLKSNDIPYFRVLQPEGCMMIIGPDVYHQGINLGENVAASTNFGCISWCEMVLAKEKTFASTICQCKGVSTTFSEYDEREIMKLFKFYQCQSERTKRSQLPQENPKLREKEEDQKNRNKAKKYSGTIFQICNTGDHSSIINNQHESSPITVEKSCEGSEEKSEDDDNEAEEVVESSKREKEEASDDEEVKPGNSGSRKRKVKPNSSPDPNDKRARRSKNGAVSVNPASISQRGSQPKIAGKTMPSFSSTMSANMDASEVMFFVRMRLNKNVNDTIESIAKDMMSKGDQISFESLIRRVVDELAKMDNAIKKDEELKVGSKDDFDRMNEILKMQKPGVLNVNHPYYCAQCKKVFSKSAYYRHIPTDHFY